MNLIEAMAAMAERVQAEWAIKELRDKAIELSEQGVPVDDARVVANTSALREIEAEEHESWWMAE
jgi:hypothetical protein